MKPMAAVALAACVVSLSGCGAIQSYNQTLDAKQLVWHRQQLILDEQNKVMQNDLISKQKQQLIEQARAEGEMEQAKAQGVADATVIAARAEGASILVKAEAQAAANKLISASLTPLFVQNNVQSKIAESLSDKTTIYLPSNVLPLLQVGAGTK